MENIKKKKKISKRKIALIALSCVLLCILITVGVLFGPGIFAKKAPPVEAPATAKSMRKEAPTDGTLPTEVSDPLDNIAYLAYVLDNQPYFKNYAYNSTVAMGYEQVTKSWKDYKGAELTGVGKSVMVCSDLTHSLLVKSATQTCFVGGTDAYLRTGNKPGADTLPTEIGWGENLTRYTHDSYLTAYGEFSTELTVYVINEETVASVGDVKDNGDGTYSQSVSLTPQAACWYQYGMKTRGSLKGFPVFHSIDITFTYDAKWQVLESYCVEDATIAPSALGGSPQNSASKTTTTFTYGAEAIDENHFAYFDNFYKSRLDVSTEGGEVKPAEPDMLAVLGSGFRNVMDASRGQQFSLGLKVGQVEYDGKAYAKLGDMGDVLGTLDVRLALGRKDAGKQDFYLEFASGGINAYYGNGFAMTADLNKVSASVGKLTEKIKELAGGGEKLSIYSLFAAGEDNGGDFDFNAILDEFGFELSETGAVIKIKSDDLMGLGIGVDAVMNFSRTMDETGGIFDFENFTLNSLSIGGEKLELTASLTPDESEPIKRDTAATPADLSEYIDGIYKLLDSNTVKVDVSLADKLVEGLSLEAAAYVKIAESLAARVDVSAEYKGVSLKLTAYYEYGENYGKIYINLTELNGKEINAKVCCSVDELVETVTKLIGRFADTGVVEENNSQSLAAVINKVLNLDFAQIIGGVSGDAHKISVAVNVDKLLSGLDISAGFEIGELSLELLNDGGALTLNGSLAALGLGMSVCGSDYALTLPEDKGNYVDIIGYIDSVSALLNADVIRVNLQLADKLVEGLTAQATAFVSVGETPAVRVSMTVNYNRISAKLNAYYVYDGGYGKVYINLTELNGQQLNAKIYCDIKEVAEAIQKLIGTQISPEIQMPEITVSKVIEVILQLDYNTLLKADNEKLAITVNADEVLNGLGIDLGMSFGEITLEYEKATSELTGEIPALGVKLGVSASEEQVTAPADKENYVDIIEYVDSIAKLVLGGKYHLGLEFDGAKTQIEQVKAVYANVSAEVEFKGENKTVLAVSITNATAKYENITLTFNAYYEIDLKSGSYGKIYLNVTELNGQQLNAKIYCDIKEVAEAIQKLIGTQISPEIQMPEITVSKVIEVILQLDYNTLLKADNEKLAITVNADEVLNGLGIDLGMSFGEITLEYEKATSELTGEIPALGVKLGVSASEEQVTAPADKENYVDATDIISLINSAIDEVNAIIDAKDLSFTVGAKYEKDGVSASINGTGEVIWAADGIKIALSLDVNVLQNGENLQFSFGFVYDRTAYDGNNQEKPFAIVTVNNTGLKVYRSETDNLADAFGGLIEAIKKLASNDTVAPVASGYGVRGFEINDILYNENVKTIISSLLELAGKLTIGFEDINGDTARELVIRHAAGGSLTLDTDGCLALTLKVKDFDISISAEAGSGLTVDGILSSFEEGYFFYEDIDSFVKYLLNEVLNSLDALKLKDVLGAESYSVDFILDGKASGLKALENVYIKGETYYTENLSDERLGNNLFKTDLHLVINGTVAEASLSYSARNVYVAITEIGNMKFADLKFKASADELYSAIEQLVRLVTDTNLVSLLGGNTPYTTRGAGMRASVEGGNTVLTDVLYAFLNMDLAESFKFDKISGTAEINIDDILEAAAGIKIGTIKIVADKKNHVVSASVTCGDGTWLSFEANPAAFDDNDKNKINPDDYIDIGFIATLLSDIKNILTDDNGNIYKLYTYTGTIKANIIVAGDVTLNNVTLTAGFDNDGDFYFTLAARLEKKTFIWDAADIGITYSHGLITLSRNMNTDGEEFKIMTIEYLLDNLFNKQSPIAWLLGMNPSTWSTIMNMAVKDVNVSSGLTTPQTYNLFETQQVVTDSRINIADYIAGMKVAINGQSVSEYGNAASGALSKFGNMDGNYYAFDVKANELTGGALTELYAAITRSDDRGISGIKAYGAVKSFVSFTVDLDTYREGITDTLDGADDNYLYAPSSPEFGTVAAPDYYAYVAKTYGFDANYTFEAVAGSHYTPVFGCFEAGKDVNNYIASNVLETVFLDVYDGEEVERTLEVRYGSTVNLLSAFPEFASDGRKLIYLGANGEKLPASVVIEEGGVLPIIDGRVSIYKSSEDAQAVTFDFSGLIQPVTAALGDDEALASYELDGYTFLGWYGNPQFTGDKLGYVSDIVPVDGVKTVYGWYVKTEIMVNGVIYTFNADNGGRYAVTGFGETEIKPFTTENSVLTLENSFTFGNREYKVTEISEGAFANAMLKNVVVPSNIVTVGKLAFLNNYGIKSVTFLADSVYLQGGTQTGYTAFDANVTNDAPFYNCGESDGATTTLLDVYYNEITCDGDKDWRHFLRIMTYVPAKANHYYIGFNGGTLNAKGSWAYAEYTLNGNFVTLSELGLSNGVTTDTALTDCAALESYVSGVLDAKTASEYVNGYSVTVVSVKADGKISYILTITQNSASERYYKFNLSVAEDSAANAVIEAEHKVYGADTYVKYGATVKVLPAIDGFTVKAVTSSQNLTLTEEEDFIAFVMPDGVADMCVACEKETVKEVKIISEKVSFSYDGSSAANEFTVSGVEEGVTQLSAPKAEGYYFLGWTYLDGENLVFCDSTVTYSVYYPVWGVKRDGLEASGAIAAGGSPNAEANGLNLTVAEGAFYKWYKDAAFGSEADTLEKTDTLLYSRMQYNLNVTVSGKCREVAIGSVKDSYGVAKNLEVTKDFAIYEGETIYLKNDGNNNKDYYIGRLTADGNKEDFSGQIYIKAYVFPSVKTIESVAKFDGNDVDFTKEDNHSFAYNTVNGNINYTFTC